MSKRAEGLSKLFVWAVCLAWMGAACSGKETGTSDAGAQGGTGGSATGGSPSSGGAGGSPPGAGGTTSSGGAAGGVSGAGGTPGRGGARGPGGTAGGRAGDAGGSGAAGWGGAAGDGRGGSTGDGGAGAGGAAFNPCLPGGAACRVMPLGDSITDGVGSSAPGGGYRLELFHDAVQAHEALTFVGSATDPNGPATLDGKMFPRNHEGHPGYTIDDSATTSGISPLVDQSIAVNHPQIILLMIGTNDVNRNIDVANAPARLGALLDRLIADAPNALLVVAKITPTPDAGANSVIQTYNDAIARIVQTHAGNGNHVVLVDMYAPFTARANYSTALMSDFLHPNDAGYAVMGDVWYGAIRSYLPAAP
jgi:lysophospholipase L1-like esterase